MNNERASGLLIVVSSFPKLGDAQTMAYKLIERRLAACVQIQEGIHSVYRWEDKICEEQEVLLSAKTAVNQWEQICSFIKSNHPYDLPEVLALTSEKYEEHYGNWVQAEVKSWI